MAGFIIDDSVPSARYNQEAVDQSIASHNRRSSAKIGKREAALIHALLKGWKGQ